MQRLSQGQVVKVAVADPRGQNKKSRPVVILTDTDEISVADTLVVAAISTKFSDPLPPDCILLPWAPDGRARSGLNRPSVVKCHWLVKVARQDVVSVLGCLPPEIIQSIMQIVEKE